MNYLSQYKEALFKFENGADLKKLCFMTLTANSELQDGTDY